MKPLYLLLLFGTAIVACHRPSGNGYTPLTPSSLYNPDSVLFATDGGDEKAADKLLTAAIRKLRKEKDSAGSIELFEQAILQKPTARAYFELSAALLGAHRDSEAIQAISIAEKMGYTPLANVMFRYCYTYSRMMPPFGTDSIGDRALHYMALALQMGYAHPQDFLRRDVFPALNRYYEFSATFNDAVGAMAGRDPQKSLWENYTTQFPETTFPLTLDMHWIKSHPPDDQISYEFEKFIPEMRSAKFDRGGGEVYYYTALIKNDPAYIAVVYGKQYEGEDEPTTETDSTNPAAASLTTLTPVYYLATYDHHGKIIDRMQVAGRDDLTQPFKAFAVQSNLHFQVEDFTNEYKQDSLTNTVDTNSVIGIKAQAPVHFLVDAGGKFVRTDAPLAVR